MTDEDTTLGELKKKVARFRDERGWRKYHNPKDLAVSISIEAAELLELFQWKDEKEVEETVGDEEGMKKVTEELADVVIYCIALADVLGVELSEAVERKIQENSRRYPVSKARGKYRKYSEP
jgi:NTP pyrophosphatase (non-canonical NTP hydrolase)